MPPLPFQQLVREEYLKIYDIRIPQIHCDNFVPELSEVDQVVCLVVHFDGEVLNGGLEQWLLNPTGEFPYETLNALDRIGAVVSAGLVRAVLAMFPDGQVSKDQEERERQYDSLTDEQRIQIDQLSDVYGCEGGREHGQIFELVHDFVQKSRSAAPDGNEG